MKNRTEKRKEVEGYPESILKLQQKQAQEDAWMRNVIVKSLRNLQ